MLPRDAAGTAVRRLDYRPPAYLVDAVELTLELDPTSTFVTASLSFRRNPAAGAPDPGGGNPPLVLDGEDQDELSVALDGVTLARERWTQTATSLALHDPPSAGRLEIRSRISPAANTALEGLYVSSGVFCTQCEPEGFRRIACFPDRPDVLAVYTVTIIADRARCPVLLSNGNRVAAGDLPGGRHFVRWHDPFPKPTYLFALVAGDIAALEDTFTTRSGRRVALAIYSTPANLERCRHAMESLKRAMRWDEERYGREYDLDTFMIYCADDFNMGAMENKGLNIFNSKLVLARPDTATDDDFQAIEGVVAHEYFHNWTGNRVTCRDWFQLSLKEGLTVFRDQEFSADVGSRAVERIAAVNFLRTHQFPEDAGPMAHPVRPDEYLEINNFYTKTVYEKGAELIRMQHTLLGAECFRRGMDLYFERHDGQAVTCDDFVQAMQDAARETGTLDLTQFRRWYSQAGTPALHVRGAYDPATRSYTLDVRQDCPPSPGQPQKAPFHIPMALGLVGPDGADLPLRLAGEAAAGPTTRIVHVTEARHTFRFVDVPVAPVPSLLRGLSAPVKLDADYSAADLALLAAHDSDPVNRWDAAQRCFCGAILREAQRRAAGAPPALDPALADVVRQLLADDDGDPALRALALAPPSLAWLAEQVETIDVDALCAARDFVIHALALAARPALLAAVSSRPPPQRYAPEQAQIGPRALRNRCLHYVGALDDGPARALVVAQYDGAGNMTDVIAALAAINHSAAPERAAMFARFEAKWHDDPLVLDKWFALQATAQRPDTLARVQALCAHPKFNARNPNRVRSLVGAFAMHNWRGFHAADGSGYAFVTAQIMALDRVNPHVSSLLANAFNQWRRHAGPRRALQRAALEQIGAMTELSPDVREIVGRNLAG